MNVVRIGIVGDFNRGKHSHWATAAALFHAAARLGIAVEPHWVATPSVSATNSTLRHPIIEGYLRACATGAVR